MDNHCPFAPLPTILQRGASTDAKWPLQKWAWWFILNPRNLRKRIFGNDRKGVIQ
jgi:hypothetical protein